MWYSNPLHFPIQELYKEYAQFSARSTDSEGSRLQHQNMLSQDIRRWSSRIRTWSMKHQKNMISEVEALKFLWYHAKALQSQKTRRCSAPSCNSDSDYLNVVFTNMISEVSTR